MNTVGKIIRTRLITDNTTIFYHRTNKRFRRTVQHLDGDSGRRSAPRSSIGFFHRHIGDDNIFTTDRANTVYIDIVNFQFEIFYNHIVNRRGTVGHANLNSRVGLTLRSEPGGAQN